MIIVAPGYVINHNANRTPFYRSVHPASHLAEINSPAERVFKTAYYLRLNAEDKPGALADVTRILADHHISIEAIIQREPVGEATAIPIILLTEITLEHEMNVAITKIEALKTVTGKVNRIRLETLR